MPQHVFAWLAGYGHSVIPWAPYRIERVPGNDRGVICARAGVWGDSRVLVEVPERGGPPTVRRLEWSLFPKRIAEVLAGRARPHLPPPPQSGWQLQCELFVTDWPPGFVLRSTDSFPPPFDLEGPHESCLWIQGPVTGTELPPLAEMRTEDQQFTGLLEGTRGPIAEFQYDHDGTPHCMFQGVIPYHDDQVLVVTGQCQPGERELTLAGVRLLASSLVPCPPPADLPPPPEAARGDQPAR